MRRMKEYIEKTKLYSEIAKKINGTRLECPKCGGKTFTVEDTIEITDWWKIFGGE